MYRIVYMPGLHVLEITITGFLSEPDVIDFARELGEKLAETSTVTPPNSLYNYTDAAIQSQTVIGMLQGIARRVKPGRRIALYSEGPLARMQARRISDQCPTMGVFENRAAALAWLQAPAVEAAA